MRAVTKDTLTGNLACFTAYLIFGFNIIFCKNIANDGNVSPMSLFLLRSAGALLLFCIASTVTRTKERVEVRDLWKIALASMLGLFLTQFSFLEAITMTTAVDASVLSLMTPVMTMIVAAIALRDRITAHGIIGLAVSFSGVLFIVLNSVGSSGGADRTTLGGVLLMFVNTLSFACYVGIFQAAYPEIQRYYLHEVEVRLFHRVCPAVRTRPAADGFPGIDPGHRVAGALRRGVRDLHLLFPHTHRAEAPEAHVSVHVLLRAAGGGHVYQPCRRHGHDDVGQGSGCGAGLPRGGDCQFLPTPISSMPRWAQVLTWLNPPRYFIEMLRGVYLQGCTLADLGTQLLALLGFDVFFGTWAVLSYRKTA